MKILSLKAENVKRLKAVEITPSADGGLVIVSGKNNQGKTSVLDSIMYALSGGRTLPAKPIRDGEEKAEVTLDLGTIIVTRTFTAAGKSYLSVKSPDGAKYSSPQAILDDLVGQLSFDPLEFSRMDAKKRRATLLALAELDIDLDANAEARKAMETQRRDVGRDLKALQAQFAAMAPPAEDLPSEEVSVSKLTEEFRLAQAHNADLRRILDEQAKGQERIAVLAAELAELEERVAEIGRIVEGRQLVDEDAIAAKLEKVDQTNQAVRSAGEYRRLKDAVEAKEAEHGAAQASIDALDKKRQQALDTAVLPIPGLSVTEADVTFEDIPYDQLSSSRQLRVSLAMAMALNPKLRVIRITDGSLLDSESLAVVREMVEEKDFQVWTEMVDETGELGIVIEDGMVKA